MNDRVLVVYGALRSGTTMLRLMINGNSKLFCIGETDYLFDHLGSDPEGHYRIERMQADRIFRAAGLSPPSRPGRAGADELIAQMAERGGRQPVLMVHRSMDRLVRLYPEARVVHLVRDPRDVARSCIALGWAGNVYHGVGRWLDTEASWVAHAPRLQTPPLAVRYEDLVTDPRRELERICAFFGTAFEEAMLEYDTRSTYGKVDPKLANQWKTRLSPEELALLEHRAGPLMESLGYARAVPPLAAIGPLRAVALKVQDKAAVWGGSIRRFGLVNVLARSVGRRLGLWPLQRWAQGRIDTITIPQLK